MNCIQEVFPVNCWIFSAKDSNTREELVGKKTWKLEHPWNSCMLGVTLFVSL